MTKSSRNVIASRLTVDPLTRSGFVRFGEVIEAADAHHYPINQGYAERFHDLARIDTLAEGGETIVSLFHGKPRPQPIEIGFVERHPLGSQAFYPLQDRDWLIVVAEADARPSIATLRAFRATGRQGVNYARNVWHYPLLVLDQESDFLIIDRKGPGNNLEEVALPLPAFLVP
jgi:ureidoglycolate lyase